MKTKVFALLAVLIGFVGVGFSSCDKSADELMAPVVFNEMKNDESPSTVQTRALSDWTGKDVKDSNGSLVNGIFLYKRGNTYVIKVNLSKRQIRAYYETSGTTNSKGALMFNISKALNYNLSNYGWYALINASFFWFKYNPTPLSFYLRKDGKTIAAGTGSYASETSSDGPRKYFGIHNRKAYIGNAQWTKTLSGITPTSETEMKQDMEKRLPRYNDIFCGLDPLLNKKRWSESIGRTMVGINTANRNIVYILVSAGLIQKKAHDYLVDDFGCNEVVMFDGSDSSQFKFLDTDNLGWGVNLGRSVPVFFAIK